MEPTGFLGLQTSPECRSSLLQAPFCLHLYLIDLISFGSWQDKLYRISRDLLAKINSFMWTYVVPHWRDQITTHLWWLMIPTKASVASHSSHWPLMTLLALLWPCFSAALAKNLQPSFKEQRVEMGGGKMAQLRCIYGVSLSNYLWKQLVPGTWSLVMRRTNCKFGPEAGWFHKGVTYYGYWSTEG